MTRPWLLFAALVHTAVFIGAGLAVVSALTALLDHGSLSSMFAEYARYASLGWDALWNQRRRPFALCVLANLVLLPAVFAVRSTSATLAGRPLGSGDLTLRALGYATAAGALFVVAMFVTLGVISYRIATIGSIGLFFYTLTVLVWNVVFVALAAPTQRLVDGVIRRWGTGAPAGDGAAVQNNDG
jgi:hypothetical protein